MPLSVFTYYLAKTFSRYFNSIYRCYGSCSCLGCLLTYVGSYVCCQRKVMKNSNYSFKQNHKGFTLLEMIVVIVLIGWLGLIILDRVWKFRVYAEEAAVTVTIGNIRSALGLEVAKLAVRGKIKNIANLTNTNPMKLLAQTPNNYLGEVTNISQVEDKGVWYFNNIDHTLNYIVNYTENFNSNVKGIKRTRHRLKVVYTDNNSNNRFDKNIDSINGLDLVALEPFHWLVEK